MRLHETDKGVERNSPRFSMESSHFLHQLSIAMKNITRQGDDADFDHGIDIFAIGLQAAAFLGSFHHRRFHLRQR